jgi:hypothetical protein
LDYVKINFSRIVGFFISLHVEVLEVEKISIPIGGKEKVDKFVIFR